MPERPVPALAEAAHCDHAAPFSRTTPATKAIETIGRTWHSRPWLVGAQSTRGKRTAARIAVHPCQSGPTTYAIRESGTANDPPPDPTNKANYLFGRA